jgi:hypothetical protein
MGGGFLKYLQPSGVVTLQRPRLRSCSRGAGGIVATDGVQEVNEAARQLFVIVRVV